MNFDNGYDTDYTTPLDEVSDNEIKAIINSREWNKEYVLAEIAEHYGYSKEAIELMRIHDKWDDLIDSIPERYIEDNYELIEGEYEPI